jgi:hypothetical protein
VRWLCKQLQKHILVHLWTLRHSPPSDQAYQILYWGLVIASILAGIDKFFNNLK